MLRKQYFRGEIPLTLLLAFTLIFTNRFILAQNDLTIASSITSSLSTDPITTPNSKSDPSTVTTPTVPVVTDESSTPTTNAPKDYLEGYFISTNHPQPYDTGVTQKFTQNFEKISDVDVYVEEFDVDDIAKDWVMIKGGSPASAGVVLTGKLTNTRRFRFIDSSILVEFQAQTRLELNTRTGFKIRWRFYLNPITTSPIPPSTPSLLDDTVSVYVSGTAADGFPNVIGPFTNVLVEMATSYCQEKNFTLSSSISQSNVVIRQIQLCPYTWPNSHQCVEVSFALPISVDNEGGYELSSGNLNDMWYELAPKMLSKVSLKVYYPPGDEQFLVKWIVFSIMLLFTLFWILFFLWRYDFFFDFYKGNADDEHNDLVYNGRKVSENSLFTSINQPVPPFFGDVYEIGDKNSDANIILYEPDWLENRNSGLIKYPNVPTTKETSINGESQKSFHRSQSAGFENDAYLDNEDNNDNEGVFEELRSSNLSNSQSLQAVQKR